MRLMIPGPSDCAPETLAAAARLLPHYGPEYLALHRRVCARLQALLGTAQEVCLVPGPGTAGTELALCGFAGRRVLVVEAGAFGQRLSEVLRSHRAAVEVLEVPARQAVDPARVRRALAADPRLVAVALVHGETSTGVLHPVREVAAVARALDRLCVVDAVSSLGAAPFAMDAWGVDIAWSASQKALAAPPGMAIASFSERAWASLAENADQIAGFLLNPLTWRWHMDSWAWHPYPTSLPTHTQTPHTKGKIGPKIGPYIGPYGAILGPI